MQTLVVVTRSDRIESILTGSFRSSAKPLQIIPLLQSGAAEAFNFSQKRNCHCLCFPQRSKNLPGTVDGILKRLDLNDVNLHCGIMTPYSKEKNKRLIEEGASPSVFRCSCSGKHSAMLVLAKFLPSLFHKLYPGSLKNGVTSCMILVSRLTQKKLLS